MWFSLIVATVATANENCRQFERLEMYMTLDVTTGWGAENLEVVSKELMHLVSEIDTSFYDVMMGLGSFADKPRPVVGVGKYGGWPANRYIEDWCSSIEYALQPEGTADEVIENIRNMRKASGQDLYEATFEALAFAATNNCIGWTPVNSDSEVRRIVLMITDSFGHTGEFLPLTPYVEAFNADIYCDQGRTKGGFGAQDLPSEITDIRMWAVDAKLYEQYADLKAREMKCGDSEDLSDDDKATLADLETKLSPTKVPDVLPFDVDVLTKKPEEHCALHEYPSYKNVSDLFKAAGLDLIVLLVHQDPPVVPDFPAMWEWALGNTELKDVDHRFIALKTNETDQIRPRVVEALESLRFTDCDEEQVSVIRNRQ